MKKNPKIMQAPELPPNQRDAPARKTQAPQLPKKNPSLRYFLKIQRPGGHAMTWNGNRFTNNPPFHPFSRMDTAKREAKKMMKNFDILADYKVWIVSKFTTENTGGPSRRTRTALRGGSKMNPSKRGANVDSELDAAAKKLEDFSGHPVQHLESAYSRSSQKTGLIVGPIDLIGYVATRDGKTERYGHKFKKNSRPLLAVTSDGKQLHIVGGQYEFTEAGIEDR